MKGSDKYASRVFRGIPVLWHLTGAMDLAFQWAGGTTVAMCEIDPFCQKVLNKHWPLIPIFDDVHSVNATTVKGVVGNARINCLYGGFPC